MTATDRAAALELAREYLDDLHPQFVNGETAVLARALIAAEDERDIAIDQHEARLVELFLAAFSGPVEIAPDLSHEVARVVNAIRINVKMRERAEAERERLASIAMRRLALLGTAYRKLQYLLRAYPGDKETRGWCEAVEVETFGPHEHRPTTATTDTERHDG